MTDRELLELAAKAAGKKVLWIEGVPRDCTGMHPAGNALAAPAWNPRDHSGDAMELAVQLGMNIIVLREGGCIVKVDGVYRAEELDDDPLVATRRAIVRAAAVLARESRT